MMTITQVYKILLTRVNKVKHQTFLLHGVRLLVSD